MTPRSIAYSTIPGRGNCAIGPSDRHPQALCHVEADAELYELLKARTDTSVATRPAIAIIDGLAILAERVFSGPIQVEPTRRDQRLARIAEERRAAMEASR